MIQESLLHTSHHGPPTKYKSKEFFLTSASCSLPSLSHYTDLQFSLHFGRTEYSKGFTEPEYNSKISNNAAEQCGAQLTSIMSF